ncbi:MULTISPECIES: GNAT family N-acetyltransferase [Nocardia]|jgi:mycothiol synthase|uniref:GNAT family N-acetyltransferase n=1 Tax=Nocardia TaxID=1817 RepID=UPI0007EB410B|nr:MULTISPECIES: GNAT family N-acetyltransferase [Nocardia]OBF66754.1 acetyltransferase [Mycobacterium sp. 852002-51759_SCH5129042]MBF6277474.1 GNAT family N-acetyltransferase [Nocardia nova]OBA53486.1 acetyltransferase [Nocardia sp. 852002-51101_SCH5132738]OBB48005.1 acetyltransferase [Nocardia sp. 852002-51244_SCH5132740]PPI99605.1 N-acetyltransferase [Nocardia nova]
MIDYTWCRRLGEQDRAEAVALVEAAARYDEEAGFSVVDPWDVQAASDETRSVWHLPIKARRGLSARADAPLVMVAYLNLSIDALGQGSVKYAVHPDYRSRGVSTLLVEELGTDVTASGGWCGRGATSLRCWAYGSHPASERLTRRFAIEPAARLWTMVRHLSGPFAVPLVPAPVPGGVTVDGSADLADSAVASQVLEVLARQGLTEARFEQFRTAFADRAGRVVIASAGCDRPAGVVWFDPRPTRHLELRAAWVRALIVVPEIRGGGLGEALLTAAMSELATAGTQLVLMRIDPDDRAAVRLSRLLSFEQEDAHACYQLGEWDDVPAFQGG